ncbi:PP2C family protein-serine/threonine phosphatase [Puerhibacterium puerhi]|uniref:PP2C family protein-serine/threonine phosphatase n=1 Tax=Puerhibacterium puerhi TaxID=2692623 RepID=UPI001356855D|nr:PP2C family serine/threonine-protein phosphatase [Puerhibacterium puerhi]
MTVSLRYAARSDVGLVRSNNQDSAYAGPNLLVVADGMGGHAGGDIASRICIAALEPLDTPDHGPDAALEDLEAAVEQARLGLVRASAAEPDLAGMGTTVTALLRTGSTLVMAHMGDSRAYLLRDGVLTQVTVDHTFVQHLVDTGRISPDEAEHHPQRNVVMRVLSDFDLDLSPDMSVREARPGDRWMLCSDGLSGFVPAEVLTEVLAETPDPDEAADVLLVAAMRAGSTDNITVVVADVVEDDEDADDDAGHAVDGRDAVQVVGAAAAVGPLPGFDEPSNGGPDGDHADDGRDPDDDPDGDARPAAREADDSDDDDGRGSGRAARGGHDGEEEDDDADDDARPAPRRHPVIATVVALLVLAALGLGGYAAYGWTQNQYYVGVEDGQVAVFRGVPATAGPLTLSRAVELTGTRVADLPDYWADRLDGTITASSLTDARARAERLIEQAVPTPTPSASPSPSPSLSATPSPSASPSAEGAAR